MSKDKKTQVLLTGYTGFVGKAILKALDHNHVAVLGRKRNGNHHWKYIEKSININETYEGAFDNIDVVIHCAAIAHCKNVTVTELRNINHLGALNFARHAAEAGVKRFIFISSIKVNGESTKASEPFTAFDERAPQDSYGHSKSEAEKQLLLMAKDYLMEVVIIRPPLVYGPGVKANFAALMRLASLNFPLPLGAINNKRSLVAIDNLVDLIVTCINHPKAAGQIFLVSDDFDVSTTQLLLEISHAAGKKKRLIKVPMILIKLFAFLIGKKEIASRLCGNLQLDISHTKNTLEWKPPITFQEGIARCFKRTNND